MTQGPDASSPLDVHLIAIGGTGMAPLACLLRELGHRVRGSDGPLYPPMSTLLADCGIEPMVGYDPAHLEPPPDLVVVGNAVPRSNPEAVAAEAAGLPLASMPQALARFCLAGRRPLVVAGTHGKTTTTSMAAVTWSALDADPGYLIGGIPVDLERSFHLGRGDRFLVEGDEYNAAYFDRGPKFLHYAPETLILTSVEYDHADLYPTPESLVAAYRQLVELVPPDGLLVACGDHASVREVAAAASCRVLFYGLGADNDVAPRGPIGEDGAGCRCRIAGPDGAAELSLAVPGRHNLTNALGVWAAACADGLDPQRAAAALSRFGGVMRRQQEVGRAGDVVVLDDFAHHPTAVAATLQAVAARYPGRRRIAVFEPRSLSSARSFFHEGYREAFGGADLVLLAPLFHGDRLPPEERLDLGRLVAELAGDGTPAVVLGDHEAVLQRVVAEARPGDVVVCMSSGSFEGMPRRIVAALDL